MAICWSVRLSVAMHQVKIKSIAQVCNNLTKQNLPEKPIEMTSTFILSMIGQESTGIGFLT